MSSFSTSNNITKDLTTTKLITVKNKLLIKFLTKRGKNQMEKEGKN